MVANPVANSSTMKSRTIPLIDLLGKLRGKIQIPSKKKEEHKKIKVPAHTFYLIETQEYITTEKEIDNFQEINIDQALENKEVLITSDYYSGLALNEATDCPVMVTFDSDEILPLAYALHAKYPDTKIILCPDSDYNLSREFYEGVGRLRGTDDEHVGGVVRVPVFNNTEKLMGMTTWGELKEHRTIDAMREQLRGVGKTVQKTRKKEVSFSMQRELTR